VSPPSWNKIHRLQRGEAEYAEKIKEFKMDKKEFDQITEAIIGAAIEVHRALGPGLLEAIYEECRCHELSLRGISFKRQVTLPVQYKGIFLDCGYRLDMLIEEKVAVEIKAIERILPVHEAQLLTYLKIGGWQGGLLINFNVPLLKYGIRRIVHGLEEVIISTSSY
jgi:GxxExxY protein